MTLEITYRVVQYSVLQNGTELVVIHYLNSSTTKTQFAIGANYKQIKRKRLPVADERCVHSREMFPATNPLKGDVILSKSFQHCEVLIGSADSKRQSTKRVVCNFMSGRTLLTHIELVLFKRKWKLRQPITLIKLVHNMEYSHPYIFTMVVYWFDSNSKSFVVVYARLVRCTFE